MDDDNSPFPLPVLPSGAAERYRSLRPLASGGMGSVYAAIDDRLGRPVALKVIRLERAQDERIRERFRREARALATLRHQNVVRLLDFEEEQGMLFFTMEYLEGDTLAVLLSRGPIAPRRAVEWFIDISDGLTAVHEAGIIHRDVKPANILVTTDGTPTLLDFGLAKGAGTSITQPGHLVGTPEYLPPEVLNGKPFDVRSDVFQVGLSLYETLTAAHPFRDYSLVQVARGEYGENLACPSTLTDGIDERLDALVTRTLCPRPDGRFDTATHLRDGLYSCLETAATRTGSVMERSRRFPASHAGTLPVSAVFAEIEALPRRRRHSRLPWRFLALAVLIFAASLAIPRLFRDRDLSQGPDASFRVPRDEAMFLERHKLRLSWSNPGDATVAEIRPADGEANWRSCPVNPDGLTISGLTPGRQYRLRYRSARGSVSRSKTIEGAFSCLNATGLTLPARPGEPAALHLQSSTPLRLSATWRQRRNRHSWSSPPTPTTSFALPFRPLDGPLENLCFRAVDATGGESVPALPARALARLYHRRANVPVEEALNLVQAVAQRERVGSSSHRARLSPAMEKLLSLPQLGSAVTAGALAPLIFRDPALPLEERHSLYRRAIGLLAIDLSCTLRWQEAPLSIEEQVAPFARFERSSPGEGRLLKAWTPEGIELRPDSPGPGRRRFGRVFRTRRGPVARRVEVTFRLRADEKIDEGTGALVIVSRPAAPFLVLQVTLNGLLCLPFYHDIEESHFHALSRRYVRRYVGDTVAYRRSFPVTFLRRGDNRLTIKVAPTGHATSHAGVRLHQVRLELDS